MHRPVHREEAVSLRRHGRVPPQQGPAELRQLGAGGRQESRQREEGLVLQRRTGVQTFDGLELGLGGSPSAFGELDLRQGDPSQHPVASRA
jgi:hypothetical protein